jgi:hypothetical protein
LSNSQKIISPTKNTPEVILDPKGTIRLTGRLISENPAEFFFPIEEWINEYILNPAEITFAEISIEYINSVGTKFLLDIIRKITQIHLRNTKKKSIVNWYYKNEDEDMREKGTFLSSVIGVPFNYIIEI